MTAKEYLGQLYKIDRRIKINQNKIEMMRSRLGYKGMGECTGASHGSATANAIPDTLCRIDEYTSRVQALNDKLVKLYLEIENTIQSVADPVQREVLERRYLLYQAWESHYDSISGEYIKGIAEDMNYTSRWIYKIHGQALKNFVIPNENSSVEFSEIQ